MSDAASARPRVFICFDSASTQALVMLVEHLRAQPFDVWSYHQPSARVPATAILHDELVRRIHEATHFVAVLTDGLLANRHVALEVREGLARRQSGLIEMAVMVDKRMTLAPRLWPAPFSDLARFRHVGIDLSDRESIGRAVQDLCSALHVEYVPYRSESGRTKILHFLYQELRGGVPRDRATERDTFDRIVQLIDATHVALEARDEPAATRLMELLILFVEHEYPGRSFTYLSALRSIQLARAGDPARGLADLPSRHVADNITLIAARAYIHYQLDNFEAALADYEQVLASPESDAADQMNALLCKLRLGKPVSLDTELALIDKSRKYAGDDAQLLFSRAIALRLANRHHEAVELLSRLAREEPRELIPVEVAEELCWACFPLGKYASAERALNEILNSEPDNSRALVMLSLLHAHTGDVRARVSVCLRLAELPCTDLRAMFEALRGLWLAGERSEARKLASRLRVEMPFPVTPFAAYIRGAALWILDDRAGALVEHVRCTLVTAYLPYEELLDG